MNRDGRLDKLDFELTMPLTEDENVYGIKLFVLFDVKLYVSIKHFETEFLEENFIKQYDCSVIDFEMD